MSTLSFDTRRFFCPKLNKSIYQEKKTNQGWINMWEINIQFDPHEKYKDCNNFFCVV